MLILSTDITIRSISDKEATQNSPIRKIQVGVSSGCPPYSYSLSGAPSGVEVSSRGVISGTPTVAGSFNMTVTVSDADNANSETESFTMNVRAPLSIANERNLIASKGVAIAARKIRVSGGRSPYKYSLSGAPSGISISSSGAISGKPTVTGTFTVTVTVTDAGNRKASRSFTIKVAEPLSIGRLSDATVTVDVPFTYQVSVSGGRTPYKYYLSVTPSLPSRSSLTISSTGQIDGTIKQRGTHAVTVTVGDADNRTASEAFDITVNWPGDYNGDGQANASDAKLFKKKSGLGSSDSGFDARMDLNRDGTINWADFVILSRHIERDASSRRESESDGGSE